MTRYGLLIDYEFCTGCHTCELACKQENQLTVGKTGISITQIGPMELGPDRWSFEYIPVPTEYCTLCNTRVRKGKKPACVMHCQAGIMKFAPVTELIKFMELKPKTVLFAPR
jgi:Fe-S-cluster-containing dehydrogenase component